jgi:hypothetical protein
VGLNDCAIARQTGIPRGTVRDWRHQKSRSEFDSRRRPYTRAPRQTSTCPICDTAELDRPWYAYLLGMYLGDGYISAMPRGVYTLRISLDVRYPKVIDECYEGMARIRGVNAQPPNIVSSVGCVIVTSYWKHWPCLFPQHGPGPKHLRPIILDPWQRSIALQHPHRLLRGLIQSDGCRDLNHVKGKSYPRYSFFNTSDDIRGIFIDACERLDLRWTTPRWQVISIARRLDVARLDGFIGPKSAPVPVEWIAPNARPELLALEPQTRHEPL